MCNKWYHIFIFIILMLTDLHVYSSDGYSVKIRSAYKYNFENE